MVDTKGQLYILLSIFTCLESILVLFALILLLQTCSYLRTFGNKADPFTVWTFAFLGLSYLVRSITLLANYGFELYYLSVYEESGKDPDDDDFADWYEEKAQVIQDWSTIMYFLSISMRNVAFFINLTRWAFLLL